MYKRHSIRYNGRLINSPLQELPIGEQSDDDPLSKTFSTPHITQQADGSFVVIVKNFGSGVSVDNDSQKLGGRHGSSYGMATYKERTIQIDGYFLVKNRTNQVLRKVKEALMKIFHPPENPSILNRGNYRLEFEDETEGGPAGQKWYTFAQLFSNSPIVVYDKDMYSLRGTWSVTLKSEDTRIFSEDLLSNDLDEGYISGMSLGNNPLGFSQFTFSDPQNATIFTNQGGAASPCIATINLKTTYPNHRQAINPRLWSVEAGTFIGADITMTDDDILVFDGFNGEILLNGNKITNLQTSGSDFFDVPAGTATLVLMDDTHPSRYNPVMEGTIQYREITRAL